MKKFKKLTAGLLGVVMALSVCSFTALAGDGDVVNIETSEQLIDTIKNQDKDQTLVLKENGSYELKEKISITKNIEIIGNGSTLEYVGDNISSDKGNGSFFDVKSGAKVTVEDLTLDGNNKKVRHGFNVYTGTTDENQSKLNLKGVIIKDCLGYGIVNNASIVEVEDIETSGNGWGGINVDNADKASTDGAVLIMKSGTLGEEHNGLKIENQTSSKIVAKIEGGMFEGPVFINDGVTNATLTITNGTFATDVTDYMASGSKLLKDEEGNYVVLGDEAFEKSDKEFYISNVDDLKLAEEYQADGVTWVLADDIDVSEMILITTDITIDGDNHTMTFTGEIFGNGGGKNSFIEIEKEADVEVKDLTLDGQSYEEGSEKVKHGFNVYTAKDEKASKLSLNNVKIKNCGGYAIVNNASEVEVKDIETSGNLWGGINVDNADGAGTDGAKFTMVSGTIGEKNNGIKIENKNGSIIDAEIKDGKFEGPVYIADDVKNAELSIVSGEFSNDVSDYLAEGSHLVEDKDGNFVIMDEEEYDKKRPTHSYELEEGKVDRDDEEEEEPVVTTKPEEEAGPFSDVGKDNPNYDAIIKVYEKGWMAGIGDGVFAPNGTLTRAMGAMVLWNKAGKPEPQNVAPFLDVTGDAWYAKAVAWAYEQGIIAGYDAATFGPDDALTTEQFTRMNDIATGNTPAAYVGGAPNATRGWVASLLAL